jgi:hypothetical protein
MVDRLEAAPFINENLDALEYLLPRYDCPNYRNSRYSLSTPLYLRLRLLTSKSAIALQSLEFSLGDAMSFGLEDEGDTRWDDYVFKKDVASRDGTRISFRSCTARFNVVASQFSTPNSVSFAMASPVFGRLVLEGYMGAYDPLTSAPVGGDWKRLGAVWLYRRLQKCRFAIPGSAMDLVGYPTNFAKVLDGRNQNVYHVTHIRRLEEISTYQDRAVFREYALKWRSYIEAWADDPRYGRFGPVEKDMTLPLGANE